MCEHCKKEHVNTGWHRCPGFRWENGVDHHPESLKMYEFISDTDFEFNFDMFCWKAGGDGDNGESLMYLLDMYFEKKEED